MKTFARFIKEEIAYNKPDPERQGEEEHDENVYQSRSLNSGEIPKQYRPHPAIASAIHKFAKDKSAFKEALANSSIEEVKKGTKVNNTEMGQHIDNVEDKGKVERVKTMMRNRTPIDRPIILRHTDEDGNVHHHLLAGNTRATAVGYGVEAHHIDV